MGFGPLMSMSGVRRITHIIKCGFCITNLDINIQWLVRGANSRGVHVSSTSTSCTMRIDGPYAWRTGWYAGWYIGCCYVVLIC